MREYFKDRSVQYPNRVTIEPEASIDGASIDENGVVTFSGGASGGFTATIERNEGTIYENGTPIDATRMNGYIANMIMDRFKNVVLQANHGLLMDVESGVEYLVIWTAQGSTGSRGIDFLWHDGYEPVSRNFMLSGTQLLTYMRIDDDTWQITNTASATQVHLMLFAQTTSTLY